VVIAVFVAAAVGVMSNLALLRSSGAVLRAGAPYARAELGGIEIADGNANPDYVPADAAYALRFSFGGELATGAYLAASERYGGIGYSADELRGLDESIRTRADKTLVGALALGLAPVESGGAPDDCVEIGPGPGQAPSLPVAAGDAVVLETEAATPVQVRRFAGLSGVEVGELVPSEPAILRMPADEVPDPWQVTASGSPVLACPLG
jgi:hypothetical protein